MTTKKETNLMVETVSTQGKTAEEGFDDPSLSSLDFGLELKQLSADADAILDSIRNEAMTPPKPKKSKKKATTPTTSNRSKRKTNLVDDVDAVGKKNSKKGSPSAVIETREQLGKKNNDDDDSSILTEGTREPILRNTDDIDDTDNESLITEDGADDYSMNTDDQSLLAEERKSRMSEALIAAALSKAEAEFHQEQQQNARMEEQRKTQQQRMLDRPPIQEISFTAVDQGITVSAILVWALVLFVFGTLFFRGNGTGLLNHEGVMTFPFLSGELP